MTKEIISSQIMVAKEEIEITTVRRITMAVIVIKRDFNSEDIKTEIRIIEMETETEANLEVGEEEEEAIVTMITTKDKTEMAISIITEIKMISGTSIEVKIDRDMAIPRIVTNRIKAKINSQVLQTITTV